MRVGSYLLAFNIEWIVQRSGDVGRESNASFQKTVLFEFFIACGHQAMCKVVD